MGGVAVDRARLDAAKERLAAAGVRVVDADLVEALAHLADPTAVDALDVAADVVLDARRLRALDDPAAPLPPRPATQARASDAVDDLSRRKLSSTYAYAGGPVKVAFFDADDTFRTSRSGAVSANGPRDVALLPGVADAMKRLAADGWLIAFASNQAGVADGHVTLADADEALAYAADLIRAAGGDVHWIDFAEARDADRKPGTGMRDRLQRTLRDAFGPQATIEPSSTMCGDGAWKRGEVRPDGTPGRDWTNTDRKFAEACGLVFVEPDAMFGWSRVGMQRVDGLATRDAWIERFAAGRPSTTSPLLAWLGGR